MEFLSVMNLPSILEFNEGNNPQAADFDIIETPLSADKIICLGAQLEISINLSIDDVFICMDINNIPSSEDLFDLFFLQ